MNSKVKNFLILFTLFIGPLLFYVGLSFGINNFKKLPVIRKNVADISQMNKSVAFKNYISVVCFLGNDIKAVEGGFFNLNEKIYKSFYAFKNFQIVAIAPIGSEMEVEKLKKQLGSFVNMIKWKFVFIPKNQIQIVYKSFKTNRHLDENIYTYDAFIIDKDRNLRGRTDDQNSIDGKLFCYNIESITTLNKMVDDIKIVLAEYRLALKKKKKNSKNNE